MSVVYKHIRKDTNEVFYIGIGSIKRAHSTKGRNQYWTNIVNKAGYEVIIISEGLSWEEACIEEIKLIKEYGRKDLNTGPLTNMTDGGDGSLNQRRRLSVRRLPYYNTNRVSLLPLITPKKKNKRSERFLNNI